MSPKGPSERSGAIASPFPARLRRGDPKVRDVRTAVPVEQDVLRLEIAVHYGGVDVVQGTRHVLRKLQQARELQRRHALP